MDPQSGFERGNRQFCQIIGSAKKSKAAHFGLLTGSQLLATRKLYELNKNTEMGAKGIFAALNRNTEIKRPATSPPSRSRSF